MDNSNFPNRNVTRASQDGSAGNNDGGVNYNNSAYRDYGNYNGGYAQPGINAGGMYGGPGYGTPVSGATPMGDTMPMNGAPMGGQPGAAPGGSGAPGIPGAPGTNHATISSNRFVNSLAEKEQRRRNISLVKTIAIVALGLTTITFAGLFVWFFMQNHEARTDIEGQIALAVAEAERAQSAKDEDIFSEREKSSYYTFSGPADYGEITFEYPKTWSVYVAADAANGGDYEAYFNPREVYAVSNTNINALRFTIQNATYESVIASYESALTRKEDPMTVEAITLPNGTAASRYSGTLPGTEFNGYIVIFKVRDKTAIFQTDSAANFADDFNKLIGTIRFNA